MKIIIAGGRDFDDQVLMTNAFRSLVARHRGLEIEIVTGGASGADALGMLTAIANNIKNRVFRANWNEYGKAAGPIRNRQMAEHAGVLVAFWDGRSRGTGHMIETMRRLGKPVRVVRYEPVPREKPVASKGLDDADAAPF